MRAQLGTTQHRTLAHQAMIMRLLHAVDAVGAIFVAIGVRVLCGGCGAGRLLVLFGLRRQLNGAPFVVGHLPEAGRPDELELAVVAPVRDHFVRVRADEVAFQAMEMGRFVVDACANKKKKTGKLNVEPKTER